jgi:hypothetical protein
MRSKSYLSIKTKICHMKWFALMGLAGLLMLASCTKVKKYRALPAVEGQTTTDSLAALVAWVEQIAIEKRDSIRIADSLATVTGKVDTNSLFHKKYMMVAVPEVNDHDFLNMLCYRDQGGKQMFDLAFPFSANMKYDASGKPYVFYNPEHTAMLANGVFRQVQNGGVPVGLSLLGDEMSGFQNLEEATYFAQQVAITVRQHNWAAVLADDEYDDSRPQPYTPSPISYLMTMSEIKRLLPDIFLCYYQYGGGSGTFNGKQMGDIVDAMFPAFYPEYAFNQYNAPNSKTFSSCSETAGGFSNPVATAQQMKNEGRRGFMFYNVWGVSTSPAFYAPYLQGLKGTTLAVQPGCLNPNQYDFINSH